MNKSKASKGHVCPSSVTQKSIDALIHYALTDMLRLLDNHQNLTTRDTTTTEIQSFKQHAVMFTVSSSHFRLIVLLHYPPNQSLTPQQLEYFRHDYTNNNQQYQDYVCELGNNLCGVICRILGADHLSTGMSTPALLNIMNSAGHLRRTEPFCEAHVTSTSDSGPLFSTSFSLFFNRQANTDLVLNVPANEVEDESLGELEFF